MSLDKIQQLILSFAKKVEDNEKIATPILASKLEKYTKAYPYDQTLGSMLVVLSKMASNDKLFIKRAELKDLYNRLYTRNTKFAQLFQEELGKVEELMEPTVFVHDQTSEIKEYEVQDQILSNALTNLFDKTIPFKPYSNKLAKQAINSTLNSLDAWNVKPLTLEVSSGNENYLVLQANYETPKGLTSIYIPCETKDNNIISASTFIGNNGVEDLNNTNIKNYILNNTGSKLRISALLVLDTLVKSAAENRVISGAELALTKLNAKKQGMSDNLSYQQVLGQEIDQEPRKDVQVAKSDEFKSFEDQFTSPYGQASFEFGEDKVNIARENIIRELVSYGYKNPQAVVSGSNDNTVFYSISLNDGRLGFSVPVKITQGKVNKPSVMVCNGEISSFDKTAIASLNKNNQVDYKAASAASPLFGLKASDLIDNIRTAMVDHNYLKAEDALNVLSNYGDEKAYAIGLSIYIKGMNSQPVEECKCNRVVKSNVSEHAICGHTGLPLHKVYQDKYGNCRPLYRRGMDETYEGASFMNAKILG